MPDTGSEADLTRPDARRTGLVVAVPAAEPLVADFRRRWHGDSVARGVPAHVTILFPFVTVEALTATCGRFPETPPYGDAFDSPEPHLTVGEAGDGQSIDALIEAAERELTADVFPLG